MSSDKERRKRVGRILRNRRRQQFREDGKRWSRDDLAKATNDKVSAKTVQRAENGERIRRELFATLLRALEFNPIECKQFDDDCYSSFPDMAPPLDEDRRKLIKKKLGTALKGVAKPIPAFIFDEYWFTRAMNVYILALHQIQRHHLSNPEVWHPIAIKFCPTLRIKEIRGPHWHKYYLYEVHKFRTDVAKYQGTERYTQLFRWLEKSEAFVKFCEKKLTEEDLHQLEEDVFREIPVHGDVSISRWREYGILVPIASAVPPFYLSTWHPLSEAGEKHAAELYQEIDILEQKARELGYDPNRQPFEFIEEHLPQSLLENIGAWIGETH